LFIFFATSAAAPLKFPGHEPRSPDMTVTQNEAVDRGFAIVLPERHLGRMLSAIDPFWTENSIMPDMLRPA
jgi:hypothetical protein